jgi:hypothetical protein
MKGAYPFDAVELLVCGVLVHGALGARIVAMHPGVKLIRGEQDFFAVADIQLGHAQNIDEFSGRCHDWPPFLSRFKITPLPTEPFEWSLCFVG